MALSMLNMPNVGEMVYGAIPIISQAFVWLVIILVIGFIGFIFYYQTGFKLPTFIFERVGDGFVLKKRMSKIDGLGAKRALQFHAWLGFIGKHDPIRPVEGEKQYLTEKGTKAILLQQDGDVYTPLQLTGKDLKPIMDPDEKIWWVHAHEAITQKYNPPSFWDKHGSAILNAATVCICFLMLIFMLDKMDMLASMGNNIAEAIKVGNQHIQTMAQLPGG